MLKRAGNLVDVDVSGIPLSPLHPWFSRRVGRFRAKTLKEHITDGPAETKE